ncbi:transcriptional regulator, LacI family [Candidatus Moduliflexus flocculans]|uniref:Transcriptional regulator, LacI family n=1 Tax=Candidatus Moduliflexus flocculans TaxID=1499966 RepID=A0A081BSK1_9BACT|nr:transcriptional regulator, LacI family [Candidatus Moduliflexus flocculans]
MGATVIDVAKIAGVSRTTVSNVFNGRAKCSEETREAVLSAAKQLGYTPNMAAKSLVTNQSHLIGLLLPSYVDNNTLTGSPFYNIILDGMYSVLREDEYYDLMIFCIPPQRVLQDVSAWMDMRNVDGIIAVGEYERSFLDELDGRGIPVVLVDNYALNGWGHFSYLNSDDTRGGYLATKHLIARGFRSIALCTSTLDSPISHKRYEGYRQALQEAGYQEIVLEKIHTPFEGGLALGEEAIQQQVDAAFCTEDMIAVGVMNALLRKGVRIGQDFGLVGFDNLNISAQVYPGLTTIDQNIFAKGAIAAKTLLDILKNDALQGSRFILPVVLVERESA